MHKPVESYQAPFVHFHPYRAWFAIDGIIHSNFLKSFDVLIQSFLGLRVHRRPWISRDWLQRLRLIVLFFSQSLAHRSSHSIFRRDRTQIHLSDTIILRHNFRPRASLHVLLSNQLLFDVIFNIVQILNRIIKHLLHFFPVFVPHIRSLRPPRIRRSIVPNL